MLLRKIAAWCVHAYTASGLLLAAGMAVLCLRGTDAGFRGALGLMLAATFIDSTDGWLARRVRVKEFAPSFDGALLDNIVDCHAYTSLPLFLLWRAGVLQLGARRAPPAPRRNERAAALDGSDAGERPINHCRPTNVELKLSEIERLFGRR